MTQRNLTLEDLARLITNRDNPKTMDFYFWRFMGLADTDNFINNMQVLSNGEFEVLLKSNAKTLAAAFSLTNSVVNFNVYYRGLNNTKNTARRKNKSRSSYFFQRNFEKNEQSSWWFPW